MKNRSFIADLAILGLAIIIQSCSGGKQVVAQATPEEVTNAINNDNWTFYAQFANPQSGRSRNLTSQEYIRLNGKTIDAGLPYFGRAYSGADIMTTQSVLSFKSTDFTISKERNNKGGWIITIQPKDYPPVQTMIFTLYDNGRGQLNVTLTNRSPISFNGNVALK